MITRRERREGIASARLERDRSQRSLLMARREAEALRAALAALAAALAEKVNHEAAHR